MYLAKFRAYGDAGIITTNNKSIFKKIKNFRNLGSDKKFTHDQIGFNSRLDTMQAAILLRKLPFLNINNKKESKLLNIIQNILIIKITKLTYSSGSVYHQYLILVKKKINNKFIKENNIPYNFHYPKAIHQLEAFKNFFKNEKYENAERIASQSISIPINPNLTIKEIKFIVKILNSF